MGRPRFGWRVKTAQGFFLVAVLGRRCTSRLVSEFSSCSFVHVVWLRCLRRKFLYLPTSLLTTSFSSSKRTCSRLVRIVIFLFLLSFFIGYLFLDDKIGGLRYQFHSSENDDDVFFFAFAPISCREIIQAECTLAKEIAKDWKYVQVERVESK